tara:strand:- start:13338 stop:13589 length:252 start_codon:yes stop_codon:yes gene_type:complete
MSIKRRIPTDKESQEIIIARKQDIEERGENHSVYDYNGKVVELSAAILWYDDECKYVKPKSTEELPFMIYVNDMYNMLMRCIG